MSRDLKISLIGGGSLTFSPALLKALCESELVKDYDVILSLLDVDDSVLDKIYKLAEKVIDYYNKRRGGINLRVQKTTNRKESFEGTDFAIQTISAGGLKPTLMDGQIPEKFGIYQSVADTVGPGGFMRGLRHVPVVIDIARDLEDVSPGATLINYSNPMTSLTRAIQRETKVRAYGLCTSIFGLVSFLAEFLDVDKDKLDLLEAGINHFTWVTQFKAATEEGYKALDRKLSEKGIPRKYHSIITFDTLYKVFGIIPVPGDRHVVEFFPEVFMQKSTLEKYHIPLFPEGTVYSGKERSPIQEMIDKVVTGQSEIDVFVGQQFLEDESIESINLIEAIMSGKRTFIPGVNVRNDGCVSDLPDWATVEVPAYVDSCGIHPVNVGSLPKILSGMINERTFWYEEEIEVALTGDKDLATQALLADGYVHSVEQARDLLNAMLQAEKPWLPEYWHI